MEILYNVKLFLLFCLYIVLAVSAFYPEFRAVPDSIPTNLLCRFFSLLKPTHSKTSNKCLWRPVLYPANSWKLGIHSPIQLFIYLACMCVCTCVCVCVCVCVSSYWYHQVRLMSRDVFCFYSEAYFLALCTLLHKQKGEDPAYIRPSFTLTKPRIKWHIKLDSLKSPFRTPIWWCQQLSHVLSTCLKYLLIIFYNEYFS